MSAPPVRAASAPWSWLLVGSGAAGLSYAVWAMLRPQERDQGQENSNAVMWRLLKLSRPDLPFPSAAFFFLIVAVLGELGQGVVNWRWEEALVPAHSPVLLPASFR